MRIKALVKRICKQILRDKRTLALLFIAPLFILTLMYFIFNGNTVYPKLGVTNIESNLVKSLEDKNIKIIQYDKADDETVVNDKLDGLIKMEENTLNLTLENGDITVAKNLQMKINQALAENTKKMQSNIKSIESKGISTKYINGDDNTSIFDTLNPILMGFFVFFFVFLISGIGLLRERTTGTLEKLMATPIKRWEVITGYLIGYGIFAVLQTGVIVMYSVKVLNVVLVGSIWNVLLTNLLLALVALSLGILLSTFAASEFQMIQFIPLVVVPQIFFSGMFSQEAMASWLQSIGKIMPLYYGANALKSIMYKGYNLNEIKNQLIILSLFAVVFILMNIFALKRYRKL